MYEVIHIESYIKRTQEAPVKAAESVQHSLPALAWELDVYRAESGSAPHKHREVQLCLVTEGRIRFVVSDAEYLLFKGQAIFINSNRLHELLPADDGVCSCFCVKFDASAVAGATEYSLYERYIDPIVRVSAANAIVTDEPKAKEIALLIHELRSVCEERSPRFEIKLNILIQQLWLIICDIAELKGSEQKNSSYFEKVRIDMLRDYIHRNYAEKITLEDIANAAHISKGECCRIFKRMFNTTPFQYLVHYRLTRSVELLTETDYSISEIAQQVGFCSSSYYTKCFRKEYNCVPHKYRQDME